MRRAAALFAGLALACGSQAAQERSDRHERVSVQALPDGGFVTLLRGASAKHFDGARDVAVDAEGRIVVVGGTESADFPVTPGAYQPTFATGGRQLGSFDEMDVFVTRLHPDGTVDWSTFLGGPNYDRAYAVEVDAAGNVYVAGRAGAGFPTTPGALQTDFAGDAHPNRAYGPQDGFVSKFDVDGKLLWSTYLGDPSFSFVRDMDIDAEGNVYAALRGSGPFPHVTPGAFQPEPGGGDDDYLVKLDASGSRVLWATCVGRTGDEGEPTLRVDPDGRVFLLTSTGSDGWAAPRGGFQRQRAGGKDFLLLRFSAAGALEAGTYLGGSEDDGTETHHLALDPQGRPLVAAPSVSSDLPIPAGAMPWRAAHGVSRYDGYVALLSADLDALIAATYLGGGGRNGGFEGVAVEPDGVVLVGGATGGGLEPTPNALQPDFGGDMDAFVARLAPDLGHALYLSYWGGAGPDFQRALARAPDGSLVSVGQTQDDVFVARFVLP